MILCRWHIDFPELFCCWDCKIGFQPVLREKCNNLTNCCIRNFITKKNLNTLYKKTGLPRPELVFASVAKQSSIFCLCFSCNYNCFDWIASPTAREGKKKTPFTVTIRIPLWNFFRAPINVNFQTLISFCNRSNIDQSNIYQCLSPNATIHQTVA